MSLEHKILGLLHEKIGFNPDTVGVEKVLSSVRSSLKKSRFTNPDEYYESLRRGSPEFNRIVDEVIIPETWFFRDGEPFELLKRHVLMEWPRITKAPLRCLSLPCSTGEEPYSIAMALLDAGLTPKQFSIDGVDISEKSVHRAREAVYGQYSFRGSDISYRDRHFSSVPGGYRPSDRVRGPVRFQQGNLLDPRFMDDGRKYDIVFCRNVLIYFDTQGCAQALKTLTRLLTDNGLLFMGHAEALEFTAPQFESVRWPCAFAYRKKTVEKQAPPKPKVQQKLPPPAPKPPTKSKTKKIGPAVLEKVAAAAAAATAKQTAAEPKDKLLKEAGELADRGKLADAARLCQQSLTANPCNAQAYFLLGLISEAEGKSRDAEGHYNRALYLDSKHHEAMVHLALLLDGRGEKSGAAALRKRAERVAPAE